MQTADKNSGAWSPEAIRALGRLDLIARRILDGVRQGLHRSFRRGFSTEFFDYKNYQPDDDVRKIDWRLYAKTNRFFVKRFEAETSLECMMLLDLSPSMSWRWQNTISKREYAVALAASLGLLLLEQRDAVGLLAFGDGENRFLPPRGSLKQVPAIFSALETSSTGEASSLPDAVRTFQGMRRHRGLAILFSDLELPLEELEEGIRQLGARNDEAIVFHILDKAEIELPFAQATHFRDSETGGILPVNMESLRKTHAVRVREFRERAAAISSCSNVLHVPVDTGMSYVDALLSMRTRREELF